MRISSERCSTAWYSPSTTAATMGKSGKYAISTRAPFMPPALSPRKGRLFPAMARSLWCYIAPRCQVVGGDSQFQRSKCGCSSSCTRPREYREAIEVAVDCRCGNSLEDQYHYKM